MAAVRPAFAVIFDIRRGNMLVQLMYKALFELAQGSRRVRVDAVLEAAATRRRRRFDGRATCSPRSGPCRAMKRCTPET